MSINQIRVIIKYNGEKLEHTIFRNVRLVSQIDILCQLFRIEDQPNKYSLLVEELGVYLTDDALYPQSSTYIKIDNKILELQLSTTFQVESVLETMKNCQDQKKSLVSLKSHLSKNFSAEFIKRGGLHYLQTIIIESVSGNTLSVAFGILEILSTSPEFSWDYISQDVIDRVVCNFGYINVNPSLKLGIKLATDMKGYAMLQNSIEKTYGSNNVYGIINKNLTSNDINTQTSTLNLVNNMISFSPCPIEFLNNIETFNISSTLKTQLGTNDAAFRKQIYLFQCHKIQGLIMDSKTPYNKEEQSHQRLLESLWSILFPNQTFQRAHENWQILGFQNKDPSSDFRGMGLAGLKHLIYLANHHKEDFETAIKKQQSENYYPYATSGIQVTQFLVECVKPINISSSHSEVIGQIYPVLFECENALNEIYCVIMDVFSVVWKEWNVSYMSFQRVFQFVSGLASEVFPKVCTVSDFRKMIVEKIMSKKQERKNEKRSSSRISKQYNTTTTTTTASSSSSSHPISSGSGSSNSLNGGSSSNNSSNNNLNNAVSNNNQQQSQIQQQQQQQQQQQPNNINNSGGLTQNHSNGSLSYNNYNNIISCSPCNSSISGSGSMSITNSQEGGYNYNSQSINSKTFIEDIDIDSCTASPDGNTPLHTAIINHSPLDWITTEININLFLNSTNNQGLTPLNLSCSISPFHIIEFLLHQDLDLSIASKKGEFPIHTFSSRRWSFEEYQTGISLFVSKGIDVNQCTIQTLDTSLHFAVYYGFDDSVRALLSMHANPNIYNKNGQTPLHTAIYRKNISIINLLIQSNADPNLTTQNTNETCEEICNGDPEILLLLNPTKLSRSSSSSNSSSIISTTTTTTTTTTFKLPDEANNYSNINLNSNNQSNNNTSSSSSSSSSSTTTITTVQKKNPIPLPKRPTIQINNNNINSNNSTGSNISNSISNSSSSSSSSSSTTIASNGNSNSNSISNSNSNSNSNLSSQPINYINSPYNSHKNSISSPNHISPSTSPAVTSPNFRSVTPLKQTMSIGVMYSPTQENHHPISTPTSPPYLSSGNYTRGNSGLFQNINGNISSIDGLGSNIRSSNSTYSSRNNSPATNTIIPTPKDQKKADAINNMRRLLNECLCTIDLVCNAPNDKQKENIKKINENLKSCQNSLKVLK